MPSLAGESWLPSEPAVPDAWERAVYRRAPNNFSLKLLPPERQGNSYSFGFRIYPITGDDGSKTTYATSPGDSVTSASEYDVWRKWEDCLLFQEGLEAAYSLAAREKRNRLVAGKGVKKNGVYIHSDQAASWDSLPPGPHPKDIAPDIHEYVPRLSKKNTLFRPSPELVDRRYEELKTMMHALFQDDLPTLVREIKDTRTFTDFFGIWRKDVDLARKAQSRQQPAADRRPSLSIGILSALSVSPPAKSASPTKGKAPEKLQIPLAASSHLDSSSEDVIDISRSSRSMDRNREVRSLKSRASSAGSHSSSSSPSTPVTSPRQLLPTSRQPVIASQEVPIRFGHNPHALSGERGSSILESLPEDREFCSSPKSDLCVLPRGRPESASKSNRNVRVYISSPSRSLEFSEPSPRRHSSASLQSAHSSATMGVAAYLDELDVDYCLPSPTPEPRRHPRASVSSLASVVTNTSADAVIPRSERPSRPPAINVRPPRGREPWSEDSSQCEDGGDFFDDYFQDVIVPCPQTPCGFPETPTMDEGMYHFSREHSRTTVSSFSGFSDRRSSSQTSISSRSTSSSGDPATISIKAMHEGVIVILRLPRHIAFDELRRRLYDKFVQTDKATTICETFAVALVEQQQQQPASPAGRAADGRSRSSSVSSLGSATHAKGAPLRFISSQDEWESVAATHCGKMLLRIIGSRA